MAAPRLLPSDATLAKWRTEGLTLKQIAERIEREQGIVVSIGSVASALSRAGLTARVRYPEHIPWTPIKVAHNKAYPLSMLRLLAKRDHGERLTADQEKRLQAWLERLRQEDAVVLYKYDSEHGFYYVRRKPEDGDGFIRQPATRRDAGRGKPPAPAAVDSDGLDTFSIDLVFVDDLE